MSNTSVLNYFVQVPNGQQVTISVQQQMAGPAAAVVPVASCAVTNGVAGPLTPGAGQGSIPLTRNQATTSQSAEFVHFGVAASAQFGLGANDGTPGGRTFPVTDISGTVVTSYTVPATTTLIVLVSLL